jgi:hypothetical protein
MNTAMFSFDPAQHRQYFSTHGYVHIRKGVSDNFYRKMSEQVDEYVRTSGVVVVDKQQAIYDFPGDGDYISDLFEAVGSITGADPSRLVLSERHIKVYEPDAEPEPQPHKDRYASEISVGISVNVPAGSRLVLYPYDLRETNPFNSAVRLRPPGGSGTLFYTSPAALRGSLNGSGTARHNGSASKQRELIAAKRCSEPALLGARRVEINDSAGDVIMFRGNSTWHLRANAARTTMLYLKLGDLSDPLGEDPRTPEIRRKTLEMLGLDDHDLLRQVPLIGRRVDYFQRYLTREWLEVPSAVFWGEKHFMLEAEEMKLLQALDGKGTLEAVCVTAGFQPDNPQLLAKVRQLAEHGVIDFVSP